MRRRWLILLSALLLGGIIYAATHRLALIQWAVLGYRFLALGAVVSFLGSVIVVVRGGRARPANVLFVAALLAGIFSFAGVCAVAFVETGDQDLVCDYARHGSTQSLIEWLDKGCHGPDVVNTHGSSLLMLAAQYGHTDTVRELLRRGALTDYRDFDGDTALMMARRYGHNEIVALLQAAGARR